LALSSTTFDADAIVVLPHVEAGHLPTGCAELGLLWSGGGERSDDRPWPSGAAPRAADDFRIDQRHVRRAASVVFRYRWLSPVRMTFQSDTRSHT
jgi:hypothetical protein